MYYARCELYIYSFKVTVVTHIDANLLRRITCKEKPPKKPQLSNQERNKLRTLAQINAHMVNTKKLSLNIGSHQKSKGTTEINAVATM